MKILEKNMKIFQRTTYIDAYYICAVCTKMARTTPLDQSKYTRYVWELFKYTVPLTRRTAITYSTCVSMSPSSQARRCICNYCVCVYIQCWRPLMKNINGQSRKKNCIKKKLQKKRRKYAYEMLPVCSFFQIYTYRCAYVRRRNRIISSPPDL